MFNDERIIIERGKILKKINIIAIIVSFVFLVSRILIYKDSLGLPVFSLLATEICTLLTSVFIILIGEIKYKTNINDERIILDKYNYYNRKGKVLLIFVIIGYCISMIASDMRSVYDFRTNYIIHVYQLLGLLCFYYYFKKNDININYSFIENDNKTYYKCVLNNIVKLVVAIMIIYITCGIISVVIYQDIRSIITFFIAGITSSVVLGGMYLLLSFFEKKDYDTEDKLIKKPFIIIAIIYFILSLISKILVLITKFITSSELHASVYEILQKVTEANYSVQFYSGVFFILLFVFLLSYLKKSNNIKPIISIIFLIYCSSIITTVVIKTISVLIMNLHAQNNISIAEIIVKLNKISLKINYSDMPFYILLTIFLITDYKYPKYILVFSIGMIVFNIIELLLTNKFIIASGIFGILSVISYFIVFLIIFLKQPKSINNKLID